jgi:hypothetical protein
MSSKNVYPVRYDPYRYSPCKYDPIKHGEHIPHPGKFSDKVKNGKL